MPPSAKQQGLKELGRWSGYPGSSREHVSKVRKGRVRLLGGIIVANAADV